jgi:hypothetical protein
MEMTRKYRIECCLLILTRWQPLVAKDQENPILNRKNYLSITSGLGSNASRESKYNVIHGKNGNAH